MQKEFVCKVIDNMKGRLHTAVETCGFSESKDFSELISKINFWRIVK